MTKRAELPSPEARERASTMIRAERARQVSEEGWSAEHDDAHDDGALAAAATVYLVSGRDGAAPTDADGRPAGWPWEAAAFKPRGPVSDFTRAGALTLAEIDRRSRAGLRLGLLPGAVDQITLHLAEALERERA